MATAADLNSVSIQDTNDIRRAAEGMGQQRPTQWTVTEGRWWRLNEAGSARLRPEIAAAISEASSHIAGQPWYKEQNG